VKPRTNLERHDDAWLRKRLRARRMDCPMEYEVVFAYIGDLELGARALGNACSGSSALYVEGDLTVDGKISVDDPAALIVTGNVKARELFVSSGEVRIAGRLTVAKKATFESHESAGPELQQVGAITAPLLVIEKDGDFESITSPKKSRVKKTRVLVPDDDE
jgi:hypothetical protein